MTARKQLDQMRLTDMLDSDTWSGYPLSWPNDDNYGQPAAIPDPTLLARSDGVGLLYPGRSHSIYGSSESGKSFIGLIAVLTTIRSGGRAIFADFEEAGSREIATRLMQLGIGYEEIERVQYVAPKGPPTPDAMEGFVKRPAKLMVIDAMAGSLAQMGRSGNANEDVDIWHRVMVAPLFDFGGVDSMLIVDHAPLNQLRAIGAQAKKSNISGASYQVRVVQRLIPGQVGILDLFLDKDKPGMVRAASGPVRADGTQHTARITLDATDPDKIITSIDPPPVGKEAAGPGAKGDDDVRRRVWSAVQDSDRPLTQNTLVRLTGLDRTAGMDLIKDMVQAGYLHRTKGRNNAFLHTVGRPLDPTTTEGGSS